MVRDPVSTIPSGMSLLTSVLDRSYNIFETTDQPDRRSTLLDCSTIPPDNLDKSCFATPVPTLEYMVKRNWSSFLLEWTETDQVDHIRCTTTDDTAQEWHNLYEVGVRVGTETCYARLNLFPDPNREDAGVVDAAVQADAGPPPGGDDGGCASTGRSAGLPLLLLCAVFLVWCRRRS
jgi:hypothetical protein